MLAFRVGGRVWAAKTGASVLTRIHARCRCCAGRYSHLDDLAALELGGLAAERNLKGRGLGWKVQSRVRSGSPRSPGVAARVRGTLRRADRAFFSGTDAIANFTDPSDGRRARVGRSVDARGCRSGRAP